MKAQLQEEKSGDEMMQNPEEVSITTTKVRVRAR